VDSEYKITTLLIYLFQTIESETISNHMHHAGSHQIQISTRSSREEWYRLIGVRIEQVKDVNLRTKELGCN